MKGTATQAIRVERSEVLDKTGRHYFALITNHGKREVQFRIWSGEFRRFLRSVEAVRELKLPQNVDLEQGLYPVHLLLEGGGGLGWFLYVDKKGTPHLILRRYSSSFKANQETAYSRYLFFYRLGRFPAEFRLDYEQREPLLRLLERELKGIYGDYLRELGGQVGGEAIGELLEREQVFVETDQSGRTRVIPCEPGLPVLTNRRYVTLNENLLMMLLKRCARASSAAELATVVEPPLEETIIARLLPWNCRYSREALQLGFFVSPYQMGKQQKTYAIKELKVFATDPLFFSLTGVDLKRRNVTAGDDWLPSPQIDSSLFDAAKQRGWLRSVLPTQLGRSPVTQEPEVVRKLAQAGTSLARFRWRILQHLDMVTALCSNLGVFQSNGSQAELVLQLQRLALLLFDTQVLFGDDDEEGIAQILDSAREVDEDLIFGQPSPTRLRTRRELP